MSNSYGLKRWTKVDELAVANGYYFDEKPALRVKTFFEKFLRHSKGRFKGQSFSLLPWQWEDFIQPLFGWRNPNGLRRFRRVYLEVPKKNGKSTLCAGLALYLLMADNEPGAEVYTVAGDKEQASIVFDESQNMASESESLMSRLVLVPSKKTIQYPATHSKYRVLSSDASTKEGYNIHGLIFDEYHVQRNTDLMDVLEYGGEAREQPLQIIITTAGNDRNSPCWVEHNYALQQLKDDVDSANADLSYMPVVYSVSDPEKWDQPEEWRRANPSMGYTISEERFAEDVKKVKNNPSKLNSFLRYRLNIWTEQAVRWLDVADWDFCSDITFEPPIGSRCYAALDLATSQDTNSLCLFFPEYRYFMYRFWVPEHQLGLRRATTKYKYDSFISNGWLTVVQGKVMDYKKIIEEVVLLRQRYTIESIACDPYNATHLCGDLSGMDFTIEFYRQSFSQLSGPSKVFADMLIERSLKHDGNGLMRWMVQNVSKAEDKFGNIMPDRANSADKIDGVATSVMCLGLWLKATMDNKTPWPYNDRGILVI